MSGRDRMLASLERLEREILQERSIPDPVLLAVSGLRTALNDWLLGGAVAFFRTAESRLTLPSGKEIDFRRYRTLRDIAITLIDARITKPGASVSARQLIAAGWPCEPTASATTRNRLWVTLYRLRRLGFDELLLTTPRGWLLSPAIEIVPATVGD